MKSCFRERVLATARRERGARHNFRVAQLLLVALLLLSACGTSRSAARDALTAFPELDVTGYASVGEDMDLPVVRDLTVADIDQLMQEGKTFVFISSFENCPWCNVVMPHFLAAAKKENIEVGLLDTRKDPSWNNNTEIDDYDRFVELFGSYLQLDDADLPHLYVPHVFYIRDGEVVYQYQGALPEMGDNPNVELTEEQQAALEEIFLEGFREL